MHSVMPLALLILVFAAIVAVAGAKEKRKKGGGPISAKRPLTENEQPTYFRLQEALPERIILAQVAFSALLDTRKGDLASRGRFSQKVADFVICSKAFEVIAIVELDDASHRNKQKADAERDKMLTDAGYRVIRYKRTPDIEQVQKDIKTQFP